LLMAATLLTIPQVAARLQCGRTSVYELISPGELATTDVAVKGARPKTRVTEKAVEDFIAARTIEQPRRQP
jgi:excisionase family DNA binding protein